MAEGESGVDRKPEKADQVEEEETPWQHTYLVSYTWKLKNGNEFKCNDSPHTRFLTTRANLLWWTILQDKNMSMKLDGILNQWGLKFSQGNNAIFHVDLLEPVGPIEEAVEHHISDIVNRLQEQVFQFGLGVKVKKVPYPECQKVIDGLQKCDAVLRAEIVTERDQQCGYVVYREEEHETVKELYRSLLRASEIDKECLEFESIWETIFIRTALLSELQKHYPDVHVNLQNTDKGLLVIIEGQRDCVAKVVQLVKQFKETVHNSSRSFDMKILNFKVFENKSVCAAIDELLQQRGISCAWFPRNKKIDILALSRETVEKGVTAIREYLTEKFMPMDPTFETLIRSTDWSRIVKVVGKDLPSAIISVTHHGVYVTGIATDVDIISEMIDQVRAKIEEVESTRKAKDKHRQEGATDSHRMQKQERKLEPKCEVECIVPMRKSDYFEYILAFEMADLVKASRKLDVILSHKEDGHRFSIKGQLENVTRMGEILEEVICQVTSDEYKCPQNIDLTDQQRGNFLEKVEIQCSVLVEKQSQKMKKERKKRNNAAAGRVDPDTDAHRWRLGPQQVVQVVSGPVSSTEADVIVDIAEKGQKEPLRNHIKVTVEKGMLHKTEADVLINTASQSLDLRHGAVSNSLQAAAGRDLQKQCYQELQRMNKIHGLQHGEMVVTSGCNLKCKFVFHGVLTQHIQGDKEEFYEQSIHQFVQTCIREAEVRQCRSIAFPAIGTGNLQYPVYIVAQSMVKAAMTYTPREGSSLKEIRVVIYEKDVESFQTFQLAQRKIEETLQPRRMCTLTIVGRKENITMATCLLDDWCQKHNYTGLESNPHKDVPTSRRDMNTDLRNQQKENGKKEEQQIQQKQQSAKQVNPSFSWNQNAKNVKTFITKEKLMIKVYEGNIVNVPVDCIVNAANPEMKHSGGIALVISLAAGRKLHDESVAIVQKRGKLKAGQVCVTTAGRMPYKVVIHAVGPQWRHFLPHTKKSVEDCEEDLRYAVYHSLVEAEKLKMASIAITAISAGIYGVPLELCTVQYASAVLLFEKNQDRKFLKEIHFIELSPSIVANLQDTFKSMIPNGNPPKSYRKEIYYQDSTPATYSQSVGRSLGREPRHNKELYSHKDVPTSRRDMNTDLRNQQKENGKKEEQQIQQKQQSAKQGNPSFSWSQNAKNVKTFITKEKLMIKVYEGNIVNVPVDCIVNVANPEMKHGGGIALVISLAAGTKLDDESDAIVQKRGKLGAGEVCVTTAGRLPYKAIIHAVGPQWRHFLPHTKKSVEDCEEDLRYAVYHSLVEAEKLKMASIAFPAISAGIYGVPLEICTVQYASAVLLFEKNQDRKFLKEIHCVDLSPSIVANLQDTFKSMIPNGNPPKNYRKEVYYQKSTQATYSQSVGLSSSRGTRHNKEQYPNMESSQNWMKCRMSENHELIVFKGDIALFKNLDCVAVLDNLKGTGTGALASKLKKEMGSTYANDKHKMFLQTSTWGDIVVTKGDRKHFTKVLHALVKPKTKLETEEENKNKFRHIFKRIFMEASGLFDTYGCQLAMPLLGTGAGKGDTAFCASLFFQSYSEFCIEFPKRTLNVHLVSVEPDKTQVIRGVISEEIKAYLPYTTPKENEVNAVEEKTHEKPAKQPQPKSDYQGQPTGQEHLTTGKSDDPIDAGKRGSPQDGSQTEQHLLPSTRSRKGNSMMNTSLKSSETAHEPTEKASNTENRKQVDMKCTGIDKIRVRVTDELVAKGVTPDDTKDQTTKRQSFTKIRSTSV